MATTYIQFTGRLKATSQEGILAEAQQVAVSSTDSTNIKTYIDNQIAAVKNNITSVAGSVYRPKGSLTVANFKALTSAAVGDVYNITEQFTLSGRTYPAYTNVACVKAFSAAVTPDDSYWDALGGTVDLSPYAKTADVNTKVDTINKSISDNVSSLTTKISTAQDTANTANSTANTNKTSISGLTTRVSTLEGSDHVNKINTVKVNGTALTVDSSDKSVNIDLSGKVDKVSGKGLSTNDFTAAYKSKLDGIAAGANAYTLPAATASALGGVKVGGDVRTSTDSLPLEGTSVSRELDGTILVPYAFASSHGESYDRSGAMTKGQVRKLYGIEEKAQVNKINTVKVNGTALTVDSSDKSVNIDLSGKVDKVDGKGLSTNDFTAAYKSKLDGIATGANAYTLPAATASALGGVKVGQVYASGTILPTVATVNLRASDNMAVVPAATTSAAGVMTATDKSKLNTIAGGAQVNVIEKVKVNGADLTPDSEKRVNLGSLVTENKLNTVIGTLTESSVALQFGAFQREMQGMNTTIGSVSSEVSSLKSTVIGTNGLASRVTALENLLKLA